ncbi:hypothetical protein EU537_05240 [Candidatus Thorarchaeota archaeon]|nr:MAG: hypothetical protein EU537_05240 [Candidatus Thorarchaeota archaeon]
MVHSSVIILRPAPSYGSGDSDKIVSDHFNYLKQLHSEGLVKMAGRFSDVLFGLVILETETLEEARDIMNNDPAVKGRVFHAELYSWSVAIGEFEKG